MPQTISANDKLYFRVIAVTSTLVFALILTMQFLPKGFLGDFSVSALPRVNAIINSTVTILLIAGFMAIMKKNIRLHKTLMMAAFFLSSLFIITYVVYHTQAIEAKFGDLNGDHTTDASEITQAGVARTIYFIILASHIILSAVILPMVLITMYFSTSGQIARHKKIARITWPLWLYVSITGVVVYLMIAPYYTG